MKISIPVWDLTAGGEGGKIIAHWKQKGSCQQYEGESVFVTLWSDSDSVIFLWLHCTKASILYAEVHWKTPSTVKIVLVPAQHLHTCLDWGLAARVMSVPVCCP